MDIEVFGPSSAKSTALAKQCELAAACKGSHIAIKKIANRERITERGIHEWPALAIDGIIKSRGRIPSREEINGWIDEASHSQATDWH